MTYSKTIRSSASEERLQKLIEDRLKPGADKETIDRRVWDLFGEDWCVMFTDLSGFSRGVAEYGIIHFLQTIYESERLLIPLIEDHDGILLKIEGDSFLVIFRNAVKALDCAVAMQRRLKAYNRDRSEEERVLLCVGLGCGAMLRIGDSDVYGVEVNAASKLGEDQAKAWEILATETVRTQARGVQGLTFEALAEGPVGVGTCYRVGYRLDGG
jgi:class 3 adenylate cyclase